jgi:hypothetical protein
MKTKVLEWTWSAAEVKPQPTSPAGGHSAMSVSEESQGSAGFFSLRGLSLPLRGKCRSGRAHGDRWA